MSFRDRLVSKFLKAWQTTLKLRDVSEKNILLSIFYIYDKYQFNFQITDKLKSKKLSLLFDVLDNYENTQEIIVVFGHKIKYLINYSFFKKIKNDPNIHESPHIRMFILILPEATMKAVWLILHLIILEKTGYSLAPIVRIIRESELFYHQSLLTFRKGRSFLIISMKY